MGLMKRFTRRAVDLVQETASEAMKETTADKLEIWGSLAKIGIFACLAIGAFKGHKKFGLSDFSTITINNYYYSADAARRVLK